MTFVTEPTPFISRSVLLLKRNMRQSIGTSTKKAYEHNT